MCCNGIIIIVSDFLFLFCLEFEKLIKVSYLIWVNVAFVIDEYRYQQTVKQGYIQS